jgi:hypothetical protein
MQLAAQDLETSLILGDISFGFENTPANLSAWSAVITILPVTFQHVSGFGASFSFCNLFLRGNNLNQFSEVTFVNPTFFYNLYPHKNIIVGPFVAIKAVGAYSPTFFEFTAGIKFSWQGFLEVLPDPLIPIAFEIIQVQTGYKYRDHESKFYAQIGIDIFLLYGIAASQGKQNKNLNKDYRR